MKRLKYRRNVGMMEEWDLAHDPERDYGFLYYWEFCFTLKVIPLS
jgi:hypothetical protein